MSQSYSYLNIHFLQLPEKKIQARAFLNTSQSSLTDESISVEEDFIDSLEFLKALSGEEFDTLLTGKKLYNTLFTGKIRDYLNRGLGKDGNGIVYIRLYFDKEQKDILNLPWEYLHDGDEFIAKRDNTPIIRYPYIDKQPRTLTIQPFDKIRILVVAASPSSSKPLDIKKETNLLKKLFTENKRNERIEYQILTNTSFEQFIEKTDEFEPHIVHFSGHGSWNNEELLFHFYKENKTSAQVASMLAENKVQLVILSACYSAIGVFDFAQWQIPAVIGMRHEVHEASALCFAKYFYTQLVDGHTLPQAMTKARRLTSSELDDGYSWGIPVLFSRASEPIQLFPKPDSYITMISSETVTEITGRIKKMVNDYTAYFGGRRTELAELDKWITQSKTPFGLLMAPAGMGKSALAANWYEKLRNQENVMVVFQPISLRYETNKKEQILYTLLAQLRDVANKELNCIPKQDDDAKSVLEKLCNLSLSDLKEESEQMLSSLLIEILGAPNPNKPLVIIIDGLDELSDQLNQPEIKPVNFIPNGVGEGIYILAVVRGDPKTTIYDDWLKEIRWEKFQPKLFSLEPLKKEDIQEILNRSNVGCEEGINPHLVEQLYRLSENGDALAVSLWVGWLAREKQKNSQLTCKTLLEKMEKVKPGIDGYIEGALSQMEGVLDDKIIPTIPLLQVLSLARGPLSVGDLKGLGISVDDVTLEQLIHQSGRLIVDSGLNTYSFSHTRIGEALQDRKIGTRLQKKHPDLYLPPDKRTKWLEKFKEYGDRALHDAKQSTQNTIPNYILNHYVEHLQEDQPKGYKKSLYSIVDRIWMEAHYKHFGNYDKFLKEIKHVWLMSREIGQEQAHDGKPIHEISRQIKILLCYASIISLSSDLPPHLPALLVANNQMWSPLQAVGHIEKIPNRERRLHALVAMLTIDESRKTFEQSDLYDVIIISSLEYMKLLWSQEQVNEEDLYRQQLAIIPFLSPKHVGDALLLAECVQRSIWRARLLVELLPLVEDTGQKIEAIKKIIDVCCQTNHSNESDDIPFIYHTYKVMAKNLVMKDFSLALSTIWEPEEQFRYEFYLDRMFGDLAWNIQSDQAYEFVEILFQYEPLPLVAQKVSRFAPQLDNETAYNIAIQLEKQFLRPVYKKNRKWKYLGRTVYSREKGIGMALMFLALSSDGKYQQDILKITDNYIQIYGKHDFPYGEEELLTLYQIATGQLTDAQTHILAEDGIFMKPFWKDSFGGSYYSLSMFSQELIPFLDIETLKVLFERTISNNKDDWQTIFQHLITSPYILPAIAKKLPKEEFPFIFTIGQLRPFRDSCYGYVRAVLELESINDLNKSARLDIVKWVLSLHFHRLFHNDDEIDNVIAPLVTPEMLSDKFLRSEINPIMAKHLPEKTLKFIVRNFESYQSTDYRLQFIRYLPSKERILILEQMAVEFPRIKDKGESNKLFEAFEQSVRLLARWRLSNLTSTFKTEMQLGYSLKKLEKYGFLLETNFGRHGDALSFFIHSATKRIMWLRFNKRSYQAYKRYLTNLEKHSLEIFSESNPWIIQRIGFMLTSRFGWVIYLIISLLFAVVFIALISLLTFPFIFLRYIFLALGFVIFALKGGFDSYRKRRGNLTTFQDNDDSRNRWESLREQVEELNRLLEPEDRRQVFIEIASDIKFHYSLHMLNYKQYREYVVHARDIWLPLKPEFVLDALLILDDYDNYRTYRGDESHEYIRAIIPAVVFRNKELLPRLTARFLYPYAQFQAYQYACLALCVTGKEQLDYLEKAVSTFHLDDTPNLVSSVVLSNVADYARPDLVSHALEWLEKYPTVRALENLALKIVGNEEHLAKGYEIAQKIKKPVHQFINSITPHLDSEWTTKVILFVLKRDIKEEQEKCIPVLTKHWLTFSLGEIYAIWLEITAIMIEHPRSKVLTQLSWFSAVIIHLSESEHTLAKTVTEALEVLSWWDIDWQ